MHSAANSTTRGSLAAWLATALTMSGKAVARLVVSPAAATQKLSRTTVVYGAFKGMGDLICAAPTIASELQLGTQVVLLLFPQLRSFADLIDFGPHSDHLRIVTLPVPFTPRTLRSFFQAMSPLRPELIWYSPHSPLIVSSWRIPLLLAVTKIRFWPTAKLVGAASERLSWLFDLRLPIDRQLPYMVREWTAYTQLDPPSLMRRPTRVRFVDRIHAARDHPRQYDILIHPGASADNRKWPHEYYGKLVEHIPSRYRVAILGLPADVAAIKAVLPSDRRIEFITGSLEAAITAIALARVAVTMDSGPMFFAKVLGVPTISLFGPSDPRTVAAPEADALQIYERLWPCQPCGNIRCHQATLRCMRSIDPERVADEIVNHLCRAK